MVQIKRPPVDDNTIDINPTFYNLHPGDIVLRVHKKNRINNKSNPLSFQEHGPKGRFDHHDGVSNRGVCYVVPVISSYHEALATCLVSVSKYVGLISDFNLCIITITHELKLLDLRASGAMDAGTVSAISTVSDLTLAQEWSRFFYEREDLYTQIDGLIYSSSYNNQASIVFYDRALNSLELSEDLPLSHPAILYDVCRISSDLGLVVVPEAVTSSLDSLSSVEFIEGSSLPMMDIDTADDEKFNFLDQCVNTAVANAQQDLLEKEIGYVYGRDNMLIEHYPDGSEELIQYLLNLVPTHQAHNISINN